MYSLLTCVLYILHMHMCLSFLHEVGLKWHNMCDTFFKFVARAKVFLFKFNYVIILSLTFIKLTVDDMFTKYYLSNKELFKSFHLVAIVK
jgi:hypothetical protein